MDFFMLSANDGYGEDGGPVSARQIADAWLAVKSWPLYANTKNRNAIAADAVMVFYLGGYKQDRQSFIAEAKVAAIRTPHRADVELSQKFLMPAPHKILELLSVRELVPPVSIRPLIGKLSIVRNSGPRWGAGLVGGSRRLKAEDYSIIRDAEAEGAS